MATMIDGPGLYRTKGDGVVWVVSINCGLAIGWLRHDRDDLSAYACVWRTTDGTVISAVSNGGYDEIIGPVTEPSAPPGMEWSVTPYDYDAEGRQVVFDADAIPLTLSLWPDGFWRVFDTSGETTPELFADQRLHVANGRLWQAALEGK